MTFMIFLQHEILVVDRRCGGCRASSPRSRGAAAGLSACE